MFTRYIRIFYNDLMTEMSSPRKMADKRIHSILIPMIVHLIALKDNITPRDRKKYYHEIDVFRNRVLTLNKRRGEPNKIWFKNTTLDEMFDSTMAVADDEYFDKYGEYPKQQYSREDFPEFQWDVVYPV